jgi:hypothetical protein
MGEDPISEFSRVEVAVLALESSGRLMPKNKMLAVIVIVVATALGGGIMTFAIGLPASPCAGITGTTRNFTIVATINGFNDSVNHLQESWPVMSVHRCDIVKITITNNDAQAHGVAVDYYATRGTDVPGGQSLLNPPFQAFKIGHFRVYCTVKCTIHEFVINGLLNVA